LKVALSFISFMPSHSFLVVFEKGRDGDESVVECLFSGETKRLVVAGWCFEKARY